MLKPAAHLLLALALAACDEAPAPKAAALAGRPALTVTAVAPQNEDWPRTLAANGNVVAWQEAVIGAEIANYRITAVEADVGDIVKKG